MNYYDKINWKNRSEGKTTKISAERLNHMDNQIFNNANAIGNVEKIADIGDGTLCGAAETLKETAEKLTQSLNDVNSKMKWLGIWKSHSFTLPNNSNGNYWAEQYGKLLKLNFYGTLGPAGINNSYPIVEFNFRCQTNEYGIAFSQNTGNAFLLRVGMNDNKLYIDTKNEELDGGYYFGTIVFFIA